MNLKDIFTYYVTCLSENNECKPHNIWGDRVFKKSDGYYYE